MKNNFVSVIIPLKEMSYYALFENLPNLDKQTYRNFEALLLPNQHEQYDLELLKKYKWLRIIPTGKITRPAQKRNLGAKQAKGDIIAFIDDDAYPTPQWLEKAVEIFNKKKVAAVCGPGSLPKDVNIWEKAFDEVLKTAVGSGGFSYRFIPDQERYVDDYPSMNFLIKKKLFLDVGGFNNDYWPGEDSKLCEEIVYKKKGKIFYDPSVLIYHHRRNNLRGYLRQHGQYGYHRGAFFAHGDRNSRRFAYLLPTFFVLYVTMLTILYGVNTFKIQIPYLHFLTVPLYIYIVSCVYLFITSLLNTRNIVVPFLAILILILTHLYYGIMFFYGFIKGLIQKENIYD